MLVLSEVEVTDVVWSQSWDQVAEI